MVSQEQENKIDVLETASDDGAYKPVRPLPLPPRKKKKKKKLLPTDPDDPETDEDFDEDDDEDDDDTETSSDTDPDTEDENELKQEEKKPQSVFKNPFQFFKRSENMALKKGPNPEKQQKSPIQKFFDVLLYGVEGAKIRNGDLPKQNITDEMLLGLGFTSYLKDVLLGRQAAKYWKQKMGGKDNVSLLKTTLKGLKKQTMNDPAARVMYKELNEKLKQEPKKVSPTPMSDKIAPKINPVSKKDVEQPLKPISNKKEEPIKTPRLSESELRRILAKTEEEEKRILLSEKERENRQVKIDEKVAMMARRVEENKQIQNREIQKNQELSAIAQKKEQSLETHKKDVENVLKNAVQQNDKDQLLMQKNEVNASRSLLASEMGAATMQAGRLAAAQMVGIVQAGMQNAAVRNEVQNIVQQGMRELNMQQNMRNIQSERVNPTPAPAPAPTPVPKSAPPAEVQGEAKSNFGEQSRSADLRAAIGQSGNLVQGGRESPENNVNATGRDDF